MHMYRKKTIAKSLIPFIVYKCYTNSFYRDNLPVGIRIHFQGTNIINLYFCSSAYTRY